MSSSSTSNGLESTSAALERSVADRVLVMRRGRIVGEIIIDLPRPRTVATTELPAFVQFTREVRQRLNTAAVIE